jgi:hypothetical protein
VSWRAGELVKKIERQTRGSFRMAPLMFSILLGMPCLPAAASWSGGTVSLRPSTGVVRPGETVSIVWNSFPEETDEFEILLCCESPVVQTFRLTDQLDPALGSYAWSVPNMPCDSARVRIRAGIEGRGETTWAISAPFRIAWEPTGPVQKVTFREGELWVSEDPAQPAPSMARGGPASMSPLSAPPAGAEAPPNASGAWARGAKELFLDKTAPIPCRSLGCHGFRPAPPEFRLRI